VGRNESKKGKRSFHATSQPSNQIKLSWLVFGLGKPSPAQNPYVTGVGNNGKNKNFLPLSLHQSLRGFATLAYKTNDTYICGADSDSTRGGADVDAGECTMRGRQDGSHRVNNSILPISNAGIIPQPYVRAKVSLELFQTRKPAIGQPSMPMVLMMMRLR
jgi:hypothetical protein